MLRVPLLKPVVLQVAWPPLIDLLSHPTIKSGPSLKATVPVFVKVTPEEVTVAVNVTCWPEFDGFGVPSASEVVVSDLLTTCGSPCCGPGEASRVPVLVLKAALP